jgi:hypothetical protein
VNSITQGISSKQYLECGLVSRKWTGFFFVKAHALAWATPCGLAFLAHGLAFPLDLAELGQIGPSGPFPFFMHFVNYQKYADFCEFHK